MGTQKLTQTEIDERIGRLRGWTRVDNAIRKQFEFESFMPGIEFINRIAPLAEAADHHPDIAVNYRRVTLTLSTHSEGGLTQKDFDLAGRIDRVAGPA